MADLIFCFAFLRLQMTLEERLTQRGLSVSRPLRARAYSMGNTRRTARRSSTPCGDTPEKMLDKLSIALQIVREACEDNALTLNMSAGKTEAIVLMQGKQSKKVKRRMFAEGGDTSWTAPTRTQNAELVIGQSQLRSGRASQGRQSTAGSSTRLASGRA